MSVIGVVTGAGRLKIVEDGPKIPPTPREVHGGLFTIPIDADIRTFNDGDYLSVPEFCDAAKRLGLTGGHGSPAFGAIARHMLRGSGLERKYQYEFASDRYRPQTHYLLGFQAAREIVELAEGGERILTLTPKRLMVARTVVDLASEEEQKNFRYEVTGLKGELKRFLQELEREGFDVTRQSLPPYEVLHPQEQAVDSFQIVVSGGMLLRQNGSDFREYGIGDVVKVDAGNMTEGFVLGDGCDSFIADKKI